MKHGTGKTGWSGAGPESGIAIGMHDGTPGANNGGAVQRLLRRLQPSPAARAAFSLGLSLAILFYLVHAVQEIG